MKRFTTGTKVAVFYPGRSTFHREVGHVFADGTFKLIGGLHRYRPIAIQARAVRVNDPSIYVEIAA